MRTVSVGIDPVAVAVDPQTGAAFVVNHGDGQMGSISVLDSRNGRVLRSVVVGDDPSMVAVDVAARRVLVVHGWGGPGTDDESTSSSGTDVLDARSGDLIATVAAGAVATAALWPVAHPQLAAVDEQHGRCLPWTGRRGTTRVRSTPPV